jgi:hypothetical protein
VEPRVERAIVPALEPRLELGEPDEHEG